MTFFWPDLLWLLLLLPALVLLYLWLMKRKIDREKRDVEGKSKL
jgi:hypothetical protein